jgi:hypothetical protein
MSSDAQNSRSPQGGGTRLTGHDRLIRTLLTIGELSQADQNAIRALPGHVRKLEAYQDIVTEGDRSSAIAVLIGVLGFAAINNTSENITGTPSNFGSTKWVLGGAATIGGTYYLDRSWFVDVNYTVGSTQKPTNTFTGFFATATDGYTDRGILSGNYTGRIVTQALAASINKAF